MTIRPRHRRPAPDRAAPRLWASSLAVTLVAALVPGGQGRAQSNSFGPLDDAELESQEGLQSATPTDNVNEINTGNANAAGGNFGDDSFDGGGGNLEPADGGNGGDGGGEAPIDFGDGGDDDMFGDGGGGGNPIGGNGGVDPSGAFGNQSGGNLVNPNAAGAVNGGGNVPPAINQTQPANAAALMNQINTTTPVNGVNGVNGAAPVNGMNGGAPVNGAAVDPTAAPVTGTEEIAPTAPAEPPITAPPLPPPNEFAGAPPVPGTIRQVAEGEAPEEYGVEPGDTLFDVCDQLLDEPTYWPKLWSMNPEIKNPHFIFPGMRLRFYPGDDDNPPYLQVVTEDDVIPIDKGDLDEEELIAEKVIFESDSYDGGSPVEVVGLADVEVPSEILDMIVESGARYDGSDVSVQVPGFIFAEQREPEGYVIGGREGETSMRESQRAIIERVGDISPGTQYTVLRPGPEISNPITGDFVGYLYYFVGNVRVERTVTEGEGDLFVATVNNSRLSVRSDDLVVSYVSTNRTMPRIDAVGSLSSAEAEVVAMDYDGQSLGGDHPYVFIDQGSSDGVSPGMYLPIYSSPRFALGSSGFLNLPEDFEAVGVMRVIDVTEVGAVGYLVKVTREVRTGDRVGSRKR
jgi:hypothetical protein